MRRVFMISSSSSVGMIPVPSASSHTAAITEQSPSRAPLMMMMIPTTTTTTAARSLTCPVRQKSSSFSVTSQRGHMANAKRSGRNAYYSSSLSRPTSTSSSSVFSPPRNQTQGETLQKLLATPPAPSAPSQARDGSTTSSSGLTSSKLTSSSSPHSSSALSQSSSSVVVAPNSVFAYESRLQHNRYHSLLELVQSPYAPSALTVIRDVLTSLKQQEPRSEDNAAGAAVSGAREEASSSICRKLNPLHVEHVLAQLQRDCVEAVESAELIGDESAHRSLRSIIKEVESFQRFLHEFVLHEEEDAGAVEPPQQSLRERIPRGALSELVRQQLKATASLGLCDAAVHNLHALQQLAQETAAAESVMNRRRSECASSNDDDDDKPDLNTHRNEERQPSAEEDDGAMDLSDLVERETEALATDTHRCAVHAEDHLAAMRSCRVGRRFDVAVSLYRQWLTTAGSAGAASEAQLTTAVIALADAVRNTEDFTELRALLVDGGIAAIPVSVRLYNSLIDASSRAVHDRTRMTFALSLYRRLRDVKLLPDAETYSALIAVAASCRQPTQAFAFYQEALTVVGGNSPFPFLPALYTNLLTAYTQAKFVKDAETTLEVLIENGAPLTRSAFHAVLAAVDTPRQATEWIQKMEKCGFEVTPTTLAFQLQAERKTPRGATTLLAAYDVHIRCVQCVQHRSVTPNEEGGAWERGSRKEQEGRPVSSRRGTADDASTTSLVPLLDKTVLQRIVEDEPAYIVALERLLFTLNVDPYMDPRLAAYVTPLLAPVQTSMNVFLGGFAPQYPTKLPSSHAAGKRMFVAVLSAEVLSNLEEWFLPFAHHFSSIVIPFSALVQFRRGTARRSSFGGRNNKKQQSETLVELDSHEHDALIQRRRERLIAFLTSFREVIHLVSLEEEFSLSRDCQRYGIVPSSPWGLTARAAAMTLNLARGLTPSNSEHSQQQQNEVPSAKNGVAREQRKLRTDATRFTVYRDANCEMVLVTTKYHACARFVVGARSWLRQQQQQDSSSSCCGVRVLNPRHSPNWTPMVNAVNLMDVVQQQHANGGAASVTRNENDADLWTQWKQSERTGDPRPLGQTEGQEDEEGQLVVDADWGDQEGEGAEDDEAVVLEGEENSVASPLFRENSSSSTPIHSRAKVTSDPRKTVPKEVDTLLDAQSLFDSMQ